MHARITPTDLADDLRAVGLRATSSRLALLGTLRRDGCHPTAEQLHATLRDGHPTLALSTVYDGLEAFVRAGLADRVATGDGRMQFDGLVALHDHASCRACGRIFDVDPGRFPRPAPLPKLPDGLVAIGVRVQYEVVCAACGDSAAPPNEE